MKRWILAAAVAVALPLAAASPEACSVEADLHPFMGVLELAPGNIAPPAGMTGFAHDSLDAELARERRAAMVIRPDTLRRHLRAAPSRLVGFVPVIEDPRVVLPDAGAAAGDLTRVLADADLVTVVNAPVGRDNRDVMFDLAVTLTVGGFQPGESRTVGQTTVATWHRVP